MTFQSLHDASRFGDIEIVKKLILNGQVDINEANEKGKTPLWIASYNRQLEVLKFLILNGNADVNKADNDGYTPLYVASQRSQRGHLEVPM
eukprot:Pgem_evm1s9279